MLRNLRTHLEKIIKIITLSQILYKHYIKWLRGTSNQWGKKDLVKVVRRNLNILVLHSNTMFNITNSYLEKNKITPVPQTGHHNYMWVRNTDIKKWNYTSTRKKYDQGPLWSESEETFLTMIQIPNNKEKDWYI